MPEIKTQRSPSPNGFTLFGSLLIYRKNIICPTTIPRFGARDDEKYHA
jgi:hypothetical protein